MEPETAARPHPTTVRYSRIAITVAIIALIASSIWSVVNYLKPSGNGIGAVSGNSGIISQGQSGGSNTVVNGVVPRHLSAQNKADLLARLKKDRPISIAVVMNDSDAADLANEMHDFLNENGFSVSPPNHMMMWGPNGTPRGVNINANDALPSDPVQITVGIR